MTSTLPSQHASSTVAASVWSPGHGYVELVTCLTWARPTATGAFEVVVMTTVDGEEGRPALASGVVAPSLLLLAEYWLDNPGELRNLIETGVLKLQEIGPDHPAFAYCDSKLEELEEVSGGINAQAWAALGIDPAQVALAEAVAHTTTLKTAFNIDPPF